MLMQFGAFLILFILLSILGVTLFRSGRPWWTILGEARGLLEVEEEVVEHVEGTERVLVRVSVFPLLRIWTSRVRGYFFPILSLSSSLTSDVDVTVVVGCAPCLVTNSILFCWLFTFNDQCKKVRFQQTHNQGLHQLLTVSWDLRA